VDSPAGAAWYAALTSTGGIAALVGGFCALVGLVVAAVFCVHRRLAASTTYTCCEAETTATTSSGWSYPEWKVEVEGATFVNPTMTVDQWKVDLVEANYETPVPYFGPPPPTAD
jgi:hypothetical protein